MGNDACSAQNKQRNPRYFWFLDSLFQAWKSEQEYGLIGNKNLKANIVYLLLKCLFYGCSGSLGKKKCKLESKWIRRTDGFEIASPVRRLEIAYEIQGKMGRGKDVSREIGPEWKEGGISSCVTKRNIPYFCEERVNDFFRQKHESVRFNVINIAAAVITGHQVSWILVVSLVSAHIFSDNIDDLNLWITSEGEKSAILSGNEGGWTIMCISGEQFIAETDNVPCLKKTGTCLFSCLKIRLKVQQGRRAFSRSSPLCRQSCFTGWAVPCLVGATDVKKGRAVFSLKSFYSEIYPSTNVYRSERNQDL